MSFHQRAQYQSSHISSALSMRLPGILAGAAAKTILVMVIVAIFAAYVIQISSLTSGGYEIAEIDQKRAELVDENERLRTEIASYQSMSNISKRLESSGMVKASKIQYIKIGTDSTVAKR